MNWKELLNLTVKVDAIWRGYEDGGGEHMDHYFQWFSKNMLLYIRGFQDYRVFFITETGLMYKQRI